MFHFLLILTLPFVSLPLYSYVIPYLFHFSLSLPMPTPTHLLVSSATLSYARALAYLRTCFTFLSLFLLLASGSSHCLSLPSLILLVYQMADV